MFFLIFIEIIKATESWSTDRHITTPCAVEVECMNDLFLTLLMLSASSLYLLQIFIFYYILEIS